MDSRFLKVKNFILGRVHKLLLATGLIDDHSYVTEACKVLELEYAHRSSVVTGLPVDAQNQPIPWFTYPAIEFLVQLDLKEKVVLEWGSGNSSLFFSKRVKQVCSIEHNAEWYKRTLEKKVPNQKIVLAPAQEYAAQAIEFGITFDLIIIDGIERAACAKVAVSILREGGVIILDNSDRHPETAAKFRDHSLIQIDFHGFGPVNSYTWTTSLFLSRSYNFKPLSHQPQHPIGGGY